MIQKIKEWFAYQYGISDQIRNKITPLSDKGVKDQISDLIMPLSKDKSVLAANAERLLSDPMLLNAFETVKSNYKKSWENSDRSDIDKRELLYLSIVAIKDVEQAIKTHIHNERIARNS